MEQHPVPRNISGFQFHLIGDMTLKQFGYLAGGAAVGYLIYKAAPFSAIINIPLALTSAFAGFAFAFIPIQERSLDKWIVAFIKSIMSPTQYLWYKNNPPPAILTRTVGIHFAQVVQSPQQTAAHKETNEKLRAYLATLPVPVHETLNNAEKRYIDKTLSLFQTAPTVSIPISPPINSDFGKVQVPVNPPPPEKQAPTAQKIEPPKIVQPNTQVAPVIQPIQKTEGEHTVLQSQLSQLAAEKEALEKQLQKLQQQMSNANSPQIVKPETSASVQNEPSIKVVNPKSAVAEVGMFNFQQTANLISGIIKDPQKKLLPNIILTIKDKNGLPVRALKTNKLGQFSTATPLPNGTYLLEVEDPLKRYVFDIAQIVLSGTVFLPIEIIAKGEKELIREKLAKELFGNATM